MGHRLSKITTRTGDAGETGLGDGSRVPKDSARVQALGDLDELNSAIGLVLMFMLYRQWKTHALLFSIIFVLLLHRIMNIGY